MTFDLYGQQTNGVDTIRNSLPRIFLPKIENMYKLEYRSKSGRLLSRPFHTVKAMTQYVRRNPEYIKDHKYYCGNDVITYFGNTMVTLKELKVRLKEMERAI